jgi:hypothetical protein
VDCGAVEVAAAQGLDLGGRPARQAQEHGLHHVLGVAAVAGHPAGGVVGRGGMKRPELLDAARAAGLAGVGWKSGAVKALRSLSKDKTPPGGDSYSPAAEG